MYVHHIPLPKFLAQPGSQIAALGGARSR